jgi:hypothetical protein
MRHPNPVEFDFNSFRNWHFSPFSWLIEDHQAALRLCCMLFSKIMQRTVLAARKLKNPCSEGVLLHEIFENHAPGADCCM